MMSERSSTTQSRLNGRAYMPTGTPGIARISEGSQWSAGVPPIPAISKERSDWKLVDSLLEHFRRGRTSSTGETQ